MFFSYCLCYYYYLSKTVYCTVTLGWDLCNISIVFVAKKFIFCMLSHFGALVGYFLLLDSGFINMRVVTWGSSPGGRLQSWWKQSSLVLHISPTGSRESETYQDNNKRGFFSNDIKWDCKYSVLAIATFHICLIHVDKLGPSC